MRRRVANLKLFVPVLCVALGAVGTLAAPRPVIAQQAAPSGEWRYIGGDAGHTRYSPLEQINAANFADLEIDWIWKSDNFGPNLDYFSRSTPIYATDYSTR